MFRGGSRVKGDPMANSQYATEQRKVSATGGSILLYGKVRLTQTVSPWQRHRVSGFVQDVEKIIGAGREFGHTITRNGPAAVAKA